jgi:hypothetical protein
LRFVVVLNLMPPTVLVTLIHLIDSDGSSRKSSNLVISLQYLQHESPMPEGADAAPSVASGLVDAPNDRHRVPADPASPAQLAQPPAEAPMSSPRASDRSAAPRYDSAAFLAFYGLPIAVLLVLVAINKPSAVFMLRSFLMNTPCGLDHAVLVDGRSLLYAFGRMVVLATWLEVITTDLFAFLLAYANLLVATVLIDAQNQTMMSAIARSFTYNTTTDQLYAVAYAVSKTALLFLFFVLSFQREVFSRAPARAVE